MYFWGMNLSSKKLRRLLHSPVNTWRKLPNPKIQWNSLLPASSAIASNASSSQSHSTRRGQHRVRPRCLAAPDSLDNPNDWVLTGLAERDELPSWWSDLQSFHHRGARPLSDAQMQELARKQAMGFRLPAAQRQKSGRWSTPPGLASLGFQDFLPPLPPRPQGPRAPGTSR